jgi:hypothetical protein
MHDDEDTIRKTEVERYDPDNPNGEHATQEEKREPVITDRPDPLYTAVLFLLRQAKMQNRDIGIEADRHTRTISEYLDMPNAEPNAEPNDAPEHTAEPLPASRRFKRRTLR